MVAITVPDINQVLIGNRRGGMIGAGLRLLLGRRRITRGRILILGVVPDFQRRGIDAVLYHEIGTRMVKGHGYTEGEAGWVLEDNQGMNAIADAIESKVNREYLIYEKPL